MATGTGEITIVCNNCERDIPVPNIDLHRVHCARNLEKCKICGDMVPKKHAEEHFSNAHAPVLLDFLDMDELSDDSLGFPLPAVDLAEHHQLGDGNGRRRRRGGNGVSNKRLFFKIAITGIAVLIGSLFFQRKLRGAKLRERHSSCVLL